MKKIYFPIGVCFISMVFILLFISSNPTIPAQAADNIFRPLLGDENTIILESMYFNLGDEVNKLTYRYKKPGNNIFSPVFGTASSAETMGHKTMNLTSVIVQSASPTLPLEGVWQTIPESIFPHGTVFAKTFIRPDPTRTYAVVSLVKIDMGKLGLGVQAGTYYPGGTHHIYGPGTIPQNIQRSNLLLAVFNGGFMERDGHYGMVVNNKVYVPLRKKLATLLVYADGSAKMVDYQGQPLGNTVVGIRQNGAFLVRNGVITPFVENSRDTWGRTITNSMYTWRSGIGITKSGNIIYAAGNSLVPQTLAIALQKAGAVNAMQLDINPPWVRFIFYNPHGNGHYTYYPLLKKMQNNGSAYLHGYNKDFFYVYKKS